VGQHNRQRGRINQWTAPNTCRRTASCRRAKRSYPQTPRVVPKDEPGTSGHSGPPCGGSKVGSKRRGDDVGYDCNPPEHRSATRSSTSSAAIMLDGKPWKQINLNVPSRIELPPNPNVVMDISVHIKFEPWLWQGLCSGQNRLAMVLDLDYEREPSVLAKYSFEGFVNKDTRDFNVSRSETHVVGR
jgi:hypothetical protein